MIKLEFFHCKCVIIARNCISHTACSTAKLHFSKILIVSEMLKNVTKSRLSFREAGGICNIQNDKGNPKIIL